MEDVIKNAMAGNGDALREIYSKYKKPVYYFCEKLMAKNGDAAQMCAETFDSAFARLESLENTEQIEIWLKNIAAIRCYNYMHKMKPMLFLQAVADTEDLLFSQAEIEEMPKGLLGETKTCNLMDKMLDRLNDAQRMTLMFHYYNSLSVVQIAKVMSCTVDIVKQRMGKAAEHMKNTIKTLAGKGILLKEVDFRTALLLMAACVKVPDIVDAQVEGVILSIIGQEAKEPQSAPQYDLENFAPAEVSSPSEEPADRIEEQMLEEGEESDEPKLTSLSQEPLTSKKRSPKKDLGILEKIKKLSVMQQSVALLVIVAIIAGIIIVAGLGSNKENPDLAPPSNVSSMAESSETESVVSQIKPTFKLGFEEEKQEVNAEDGKVVARASFQYPIAEFSQNTAAATVINGYFEEDKQEILATYSSAQTKEECIYGYTQKPHGEWKLNETTVTMEGGRVDEAVLSLIKTEKSFAYGNMYANEEAIGYSFSSTSGELLEITDILEDSSGYFDYAAKKIIKQLEENQKKGKYNMYEDYKATVRKVVEENGRWCLGNEGITIIFNPDEVVYFTYGIQTFELPYSEVNEFLIEDYKG